MQQNGDFERSQDICGPVELVRSYSHSAAVLSTLPAVRHWSVEWSEGEEDASTSGEAWACAERTLPLGIDTAVPTRRREFIMGRWCVREALRTLGVEQRGFLPRNSDGSPKWPDGVVGSITHAPGFAAAAVADAAHVSALGIDTEPVMAEEQARKVSSAVAWPVEVAVARSAGLTRLEALTLVFSAKETIFKCLYPNVGVIFDFHDVRMTTVDGYARVFKARLARPLSPLLPAGTVLDGRFDITTDRVHTAMVLRSHEDRRG